MIKTNKFSRPSLRFKKEDFEEIYKEILTGKTIVGAAKTRGISTKTIRKKFKEFNLEIPKKINTLQCQNCNLYFKKKKFGTNRFCNKTCFYKATCYSAEDKYFATKLQSLKQRSISRKMKFDLNITDLKEQWKAQKGLCYYSGQKLQKKILKRAEKQTFNSTSIDRVDNNVGYVKGNIVFCINRFNFMKGNQTKKDFLNGISVLNTYNCTELEYYKHSVNAFDITKPHPYDAGYDIKSSKDIFIKHGTTALVPTDISIKIIPGYYGQIQDRSSMALKGIKVGGGVIDALFTGEIQIILHNLTNRAESNIFGEMGYQIKKGDKIAQIIILKCELPMVKEVNALWSGGNRGSSGLGSSGV